MSKEERSSGMCTALRGFYSITLLTHVQDRDTKTSKKFYRTKTIEDLLATLAHELTHLVEWEHTAEFAKLYGYILYTFFSMSGRVGISNIQERMKE